MLDFFTFFTFRYAGGPPNEFNGCKNLVYLCILCINNKLTCTHVSARVSVSPSNAFRLHVGIVCLILSSSVHRGSVNNTGNIFVHLCSTSQPTWPAENLFSRLLFYFSSFSLSLPGMIQQTSQLE